MQLPILQSIKDLGHSLQSQSREKDRVRAEKDEGLTDEGFFPQAAKFVLFGALIALNVRLFVTTIGGVWGAVVAGAAVMSGCFAVYAWNRVDKSKGNHLWAMRILAFGFTALELVHATASVWELTVGLDGTAKGWAVWYSHKVAFPLMAFSIVAGYAAHRFTFWTAEINRAKAESQITIAIENAKLNTEKAMLANERELALANLEHYREMSRIETETRSLMAQMTRAQPVENSAIATLPHLPEKAKNGTAEWPSVLRPKA